MKLKILMMAGMVLAPVALAAPAHAAQEHISVRYERSEGRHDVRRDDRRDHRKVARYDGRNRKSEIRHVGYPHGKYPPHRLKRVRHYKPLFKYQPVRYDRRPHRKWYNNRGHHHGHRNGPHYGYRR